MGPASCAQTSSMSCRKPFSRLNVPFFPTAVALRAGLPRVWFPLATSPAACGRHGIKGCPRVCEDDKGFQRPRTPMSQHGNFSEVVVQGVVFKKVPERFMCTVAFSLQGFWRCQETGFSTTSLQGSFRDWVLIWLCLVMPGRVRPT